MPLNIQIGQQWRTLGGDTVAVESYDSSDSALPWRVSSVKPNTGNSSWRTDDGRYHEDGRTSSRDLIELVADTPAHSQRLTLAAAIYAAMLTTADPDDAVQALRDLARRALSHADILIEEANRAA